MTAEDPGPSGGSAGPRPNHAAEAEVEISIETPKWRSRAPDAEALCRQAVGHALAVAGPREPRLEVSVVLADDRLLHRLNRESRGVDRPTDVLAFPCDPPGEAMPDGAPRMLGDIVISCDRVSRDARRSGAPFADRLRHLVVHGMLHLLDYDHDSEPRAEVMEGLEASILSEMGIPDPYTDGGALAGEPA